MSVEKKISEIATDDFNKYIAVWGLTVGLNSPTDNLMKVLIRNFILDYYPTRKPSEINEAFKLYAAQKLDFKDAVYNNMNPTFIGKVMESYNEYLRKRRSIIRIEPQKAIEAPKLDPEKEGKRAFEFIKENWKEGDIRPYNWKPAFKYAIKEAIIDLSEDDKEKLKKQVLRNIAVEKANRRKRGQTFEDLERVEYKRFKYYQEAVLTAIKK